MKEVAGRDECYLYVDAVRTLFDLSGNGDAAAGGVDAGAGNESGGAAPDRAAADAETRRDAVAPAATDAAGIERAAAEPGATVHQLRGTGTEDA